MHLFGRFLPRHQCRKASSKIQGWARSVQKSGDLVFVKIEDGRGGDVVQVVARKELLGNGQKVQVGSAISAVGNVQKSQGAQQESEFVAERMDIVGSDLNPRYDISADNLRQSIHLRARNSKFAALLRARSAIFRETHEFFMNRDFVHIDTPKLTRNDCEGGGEVFDVTSSGEDSEDPMYLSVSSQLHLEAMVSRLGNVYTLGPAFRAEKQQSHTHLSEFYMLEAEIAFLEKTEDLCEIVESYLNHMINFLHTSKTLQSAIKSMETTPVTSKFTQKRYPRITFEEAVRLLNIGGEKVTSKNGLSKKNELWLVKHHDNGPVFVTDFPIDQKPFYMARSGKTTLSFDLLVPGVGELVGGSIRESDDRELAGRGCNIDWYLEIRRRGQPPTGGFGIGFERLLQYLLGVHNIKDTIGFPRWHRHCQC